MAFDIQFKLIYQGIRDVFRVRSLRYEFVEYGTTNKTCILLQKNGFSPEVATYIQKHEDLYIERTEDGVRVKMVVLQCPRKSVQGEARTVYNNVPELFVME